MAALPRSGPGHRRVPRLRGHLRQHSLTLAAQTLQRLGAITWAERARAELRDALAGLA